MGLSGLTMALAVALTVALTGRPLSGPQRSED
jgi:hypothetical protein